jgi:hypothetical protein
MKFLLLLLNLSKTLIVKALHFHSLNLFLFEEANLSGQGVDL